MPIEDCLPRVKRIDLFDQLTPHEHNMLASVTELVRLDPGDILAREAELAESCYIIAEGRLSLSAELPDASEGKLYYIGAGRIVGQEALIDGQPRVSTIRADKPSVVLRYPRAEFERHFNAGSRFGFKLLDIIMSQLSEQLRDADHALSGLAGDASESEEELRSLLDQILDSAAVVERAAE